MSVDAHIADRIATVTIRRPQKLNALDYETIGQLQRALDRIEEDPEPRAVVLTGAGQRAFCAGADIGALAGSIRGGTERALREVVGRGQGLTRRIENFPKPVIVAVNGLALGGGCEIVEAAHLALAADHASFGKPEISLGFPPPFGGSQRLPRHIGRKPALEMILTGDTIDAQRAAQLGLINHVVPAEELIPAARSLASRIIRHPGTAFAACLAAVTRGINVPIDEGLAIEAAWFATTVPTDGVRDGLARLLHRREQAEGDGSTLPSTGAAVSH